MNPLLYGHNDEEYIVAVRQVSDSTVRLYKREDGKVSHRDAEFFPFFYLADDTMLAGYPRKHWLKELAGSNYYRFLVVFERWSDLWEAVQFAIHTHNKNRSPNVRNYQELTSLFLKPDPVNQFLLQSGTTLFKGMQFPDLVRVQIDVQRAEGAKRERKRERRPTKIGFITIRSSTGEVKSFGPKKESEVSMLKELAAHIAQLDPDVIEGHRLFTFVLPTLLQGCESHGIELNIGRDEAALKHVGSEQSPLFEIPGRHCLDTRVLAEAYDFSRRDIPSFELNALARHFGFSHPTVAKPSDEQEPQQPSTKRSAKLLGKQNTEFVGELSKTLAQSYFHLAQMCPFNFGTLARNGASTKIESLLLREYLRQKHSIPRPQQSAQTVGGYTDIFWTGLFTDVVHADVESLYPSIMLAASIKPRTDELNVMLPLLAELRTMRLEAKQAVKSAADFSEKSQLDAMQSALKILINSFYGYLAYSKALFNDYARADEVTKTGQEVLKEIIRKMELYNARVIEVDTDGLFFSPPENVVGVQNEEQFVQRISSSLTLGLNLVVAGKYPQMLSYKKKNYALLDEQNNLILRGSSLSSRSTERFLQQFTRRCIECLLTQDVARLHHTYSSFRTTILKHEWSAAEFCRTETAGDSIEVYSKQAAEQIRQKSPAYEAALRATMFVVRGEPIFYYITGTSADVKLADVSRIAEEWDPNLPDENTEYYLARLQETAERFRIFFEPQHFEHIFSADDLFGFSPEGIVIVNRQVRDEEQAKDDSEFGIWIEE
jgi:DNA polymerase elongation subunit (family B)